MPLVIDPLTFGGTGNPVHDDGDWSVAGASSAPVKEFPFQNKGDATTFLLRQKFQQAAASFAALARGTAHPLYPAALLVSESAQRDLGGGKIEWERAWATLPLSRQEPESFPYQFQLFQGGKLSTLVLTVASIVTYDYFRAANEASFPLSIAPRITPVADGFLKIGTGDLYLVGSVICSHDPLILAENDVYRDWMGDISVRVRRQIAGPTPEFWGSTFDPPAS